MDWSTGLCYGGLNYYVNSPAVWSTGRYYGGLNYYVNSLDM